MKFRTTKQIAGELGVHVGTIIRWVRAGAPHYRAPGQRSTILIEVGELLDWLRRTRSEREQEQKEAKP